MPLEPLTIRFEGHAIVSADGMIADAEGEMPPELRNDTDWTRFQAALDRAALVVLGRRGHERHANPGRRRLVLTRSVDRLERDGEDDLAMRWNPAGLPIEDVLDELGIASGVVAITGGTGTFDLFAPLLDAFALAEVHRRVLPGGTPCFSAGHPRTVLADMGLLPAEIQDIDPEAGVTLTTWRAGANRSPRADGAARPAF
jgi:hypothetical protein